MSKQTLPQIEQAGDGLTAVQAISLGVAMTIYMLLLFGGMASC